MKKLRFRRKVERVFRNSEPSKELTFGIHKSGGRNHHGRITVRHRGGGHKRSYRQLYRLTAPNRDKVQYKEFLQWQICSIEYDPNRTGWLALIREVSSNERKKEEKLSVLKKEESEQYVLLTDKLSVGDTFKLFGKREEDISFEGRSYNLGDRAPLYRLGVGTAVHSVQTARLNGNDVNLFGGGKVACAAGTYCLVVAKEGASFSFSSSFFVKRNRVLLKYPSGKEIWVSGDYYGTVGQVSNIDHRGRVYGKAGVIRWFGIRPTVRGVAMNPVDHPHGGGHGSKGGRPSVSPWGRLTKGKPTSKIRRK